MMTDIPRIKYIRIRMIALEELIRVRATVFGRC
jgi:hypothetical protein